MEKHPPPLVWECALPLMSAKARNQYCQ